MGKACIETWLVITSEETKGVESKMVRNLSTIKIKRVYELPNDDDGVRILVDRLWPRGLEKEKARIDEWMKNIAPSAELRTWFGHKPERFAQFQSRYEQELQSDPERLELAERIRAIAAKQNVTLLYAAKDTEHNHAVVLKQWLERAD
jgi:uncharacterized protein YeaO (DUF488 family)